MVFDKKMATVVRGLFNRRRGAIPTQQASRPTIRTDKEVGIAFATTGIAIANRSHGEKAVPNMCFYETNPIYFQRKTAFMLLCVKLLWRKKVCKKFGFVFQNEPI